MNYPRVMLGLPGWVDELVTDPNRQYPTEEDRMRLAIELSRQNVARGTGGPFGAVPWSGVRRLACGARDEDASDIGFDEGPKMADWASPLERRGIFVARDVCRDEAAVVPQRVRRALGHDLQRPPGRMTGAKTPLYGDDSTGGRR